MGSSALVVYTTRNTCTLTALVGNQLHHSADGILQAQSDTCHLPYAEYSTTESNGPRGTFCHETVSSCTSKIVCNQVALGSAWERPQGGEKGPVRW